MHLVERDSGVDDCSEDDDSRQVSQSPGGRESARPVLAYQRPGRLQEQVQSDTSLRSIPPVRPLLEQLREDHSRNFGWALACCGWQRELAEDALQEAYLRVLDGRARFGGRSAASTWFYAVIKHVASELHRTQQRRSVLNLRTVDEEGVSLDAPESPADGTAPIQAQQAAERLQQALLQLSARQREILHLVFYSEMTVEEAAIVLDVSVGSARTHYHRGKARLAELLELEEEDV